MFLYAVVVMQYRHNYNLILCLKVYMTFERYIGVVHVHIVTEVLETLHPGVQACVS